MYFYGTVPVKGARRGSEARGVITNFKLDQCHSIITRRLSQHPSIITITITVTNAKVRAIRLPDYEPDLRQNE